LRYAGAALVRESAERLWFPFAGVAVPQVTHHVTEATELRGLEPGAGRKEDWVAAVLGETMLRVLLAAGLNKKTAIDRAVRIAAEYSFKLSPDTLSRSKKIPAKTKV
jgi:hypothetical protein